MGQGHNSKQVARDVDWKMMMTRVSWDGQQSPHMSYY